ncbi:MAG TPA: zinc-dependent alcohol dehydrogenase family protein [Balneolales bacterium]|nr:zinc-dependent alcohol dehydrogenase family protein [Balneolales bacterium]
MKAMVLEKPGQPLVEKELPVPKPADNQVLIKIHTCGVCRTDLHVVDNELPNPKLPLIPGHEIIGTVIETGEHAHRYKTGTRVGVPWLGHTCDHCYYCEHDMENLCDNAKFTGYQIDGGYAEYTVADEHYCFPIDDSFSDLQAAPLMCAGLIGYRSYSMTGDAKRIGFYGFGAAAHILIQLANYQDREIYAFTRPGDEKGQNFARRKGAVWAGGSDEIPPVNLDAAILFAPVGALVPAALKVVRKAGIVVCAGIHMSDIPSFPYRILWEERQVRSVANLTRKDGEEFLALAPRVPVTTDVHPYALSKANEALNDLRAGNFKGAAVLTMSSDQ